MNAVEIRNIEKHFGSTRALGGICASIPPHTLVRVSGPNGAGKTTLLRIVAALTRPTRGQIRVFGVDPFGRDAARQRSRIGYLGQSPGLYGELTVQENLDFCARIHGLCAPSTRLMDELDLGSVAHQRLRTLSLGYRRRAGLARVLLTQPSLLLLDEPWNGLDQPSSQALSDRLLRLREAGRTVLVVAHSTPHAADLFDLEIHLAQGLRIEATTGASR